MKNKLVFTLTLLFGQLAAQTFPQKYDFGREEEIIKSVELSDQTTVHAATLMSAAKACFLNWMPRETFSTVW